MKDRPVNREGNVRDREQCAIGIASCSAHRSGPVVSVKVIRAFNGLRRIERGFPRGNMAPVPRRFSGFRVLNRSGGVQRPGIAPDSMSFHFQGSWPVPGNCLRLIGMVSVP
jgi:hypothetical protein